MLLRIVICIIVDALISKQPVYEIVYSYVVLRCERAFSKLYMAVSLVDVTKFACESLEFFKTRKKC